MDPREVKKLIAQLDDMGKGTKKLAEMTTPFLKAGSSEMTRDAQELKAAFEGAFFLLRRLYGRTQALAKGQLPEGEQPQ